MYFYCALAGSLARRTAMGTLLRDSMRCRLLSACGAGPRYPIPMGNLQLRSLSAKTPTKEQQWSKDDLKVGNIEGKQKQKINPLDAETWTQIYKFHYIVVLRLLVRFKLFVAGVFVVGMPGLALSYEMGLLELDRGTMLALMAIAFYSATMSTLVGYYAEKVTGILYVNEGRDKLRVARLASWGHRVDFMYDVEDVMQAADQGATVRLPAITLRRYSNPHQVAYIFHEHGIVNQELFEGVFGKPPKPQIKIDYKKLKRKED